MREIIGKAILITDLHFGRKQFDYDKTLNSLEYLEKIIIESNIPNVFILGDVYDHRKLIDWRIFNRVNLFFKNIQSKQIFIVVGNHDCYFKNHILENSVSYLGDMFENVYVIQQTELMKYNSSNILFVPWLVSEEDGNRPNKQQLKQAGLVLGHFEFANFELMPGIVSAHGHDTKHYNGKRILSGHYHTSSENSNVKYLGVCEQMTWSDFNTKKGYYILDEKLQLEFVENIESSKHLKLYFNSSESPKIVIEGLETNEIYFDSLKEVLEKIDLGFHKIKVFVKDSLNEVEYMNFIVELHSNHIDAMIIDITPETNNIINLNSDEFNENESVVDMIIGLSQNHTADQQKMLVDICREAQQLDE